MIQLREEFLILILEAHILDIAMTYFDLDSLDDTPKSPTFSEEHFLDVSLSERTEIFMSAVKKLLSDNTYEYVLGRKRDDADRVLVYGKELLSLGMLYFEFADAIREGDGTQLLRCWRYLYCLFSKPLTRTNMLYKQQYFFSSIISFSRTE